MLMALHDQIRLLVFNILAGIIIGMLFDIYRLIRGDIHNKFLVYLEDTIFWVLAGFLVFYFMMYTNDAYISVYSVLLIIFGIYIHICFISKLFFNVVRCLIAYTFKIVRVIINIVIYPIQVLLIKKKTKKP